MASSSATSPPAPSSGSPITSVPDPSQGSALASIITQVQPGQVAGPRPVRPRKPAKNPQQGDAAAKKKKKKKQRAELDGQQQPEASTSAASQEAAVRAAAAAGSSDALRQSHGAGAATAAAGAASTHVPTNSLGLEPAARVDEPDHSHQASSTLVDDSTAVNTLTTAESATSASAAPAIVAVPTSQMPDLDKAAQQLTSGSSQGTVEKDGLVSVPTSSKGTDVTPVKGAGAGTDRPAAAASSTATTKPAGTATTGSSAKAPPAAAGTTEKARAKKPGFAQRVIAIITCSSGARAMAEHEQLDEKRAGAAHGRSDAGRARTDGKAGGSALPAGVVVPPRTPNAKGGSRLGGDDGSSSVGPTTPGGGTRLPREETGDVMSGAVVPPGASYVAPGDVAAADGLAAGQHRKSRTSGDVSKTESDVDDDYDDDDDDDDDDDEDDEDGLAMDGDYLDDDDQTEEQRLIMQGGIGIPIDEYGNPQPLLGPIVKDDHGRKCLVLDLDETLVHSSFKVMPADFIVPVEIEGTVHNVYVIKRPGVDEFMRRMGEIYEVVVFTASLSKYADPVLDMLDIHHAVRHRLFRESCYNHKGNYVKDLSQLGRDIGDTIIIDNSPASYIFHPNNAVPISSWFNDPHDTELTDLCPFLADLCEVDDVRAVLDGGLF